MKAGSSANSTLGRTLRMRPSRPSPICASTPVCHWPAKSPPIKNTASKASSATHDSHATLTALQQNPTCCRHDAYGEAGTFPASGGGPRGAEGHALCRGLSRAGVGEDKNRPRPGALMVGAGHRRFRHNRHKKGTGRCSGAQSKCGRRTIKGQFRRTIRENIGGSERALCETERRLGETDARSNVPTHII